MLENIFNCHQIIILFTFRNYTLFNGICIPSRIPQRYVRKLMALWPKRDYIETTD